MEGRGQGLPALSSLKRRSLLFSAAALTNSTDTQTHTTADSPVSLMDKTIFTTKIEMLLGFFPLFFTSSLASSSPSGNIAHRRPTVQQPKTQTPQSPLGRPRWRPGPS